MTKKYSLFLLRKFGIGTILITTIVSPLIAPIQTIIATPPVNQSDIKLSSYQAQAVLIDAQNKFTLLQNQTDLQNKKIDKTKERIKTLESNLKQNKTKLLTLNKEYRKEVQSYQEENNNAILKFLYFILPFLKPNDDQVRQAVMKQNATLKNKLHDTQSIIKSQKQSLSDNQKALETDNQKAKQVQNDLKDNIDLLQAQFKKDGSLTSNDIAKLNNKDLTENSALQNLDKQNQIKLAQNNFDAAGNINPNVTNFKANSNIAYVFSHDVRVPSGLTAQSLAKGLRGNLVPLAGAFINAEHKYGVNAIFLASISAVESGWGSVNTFGTNNIFGYRGKSFASKANSIDFVASKLKQDYLTQGGQFFRGYSVAGVSQMYNLGIQSWVDSVTQVGNMIAQGAYK